MALLTNSEVIQRSFKANILYAARDEAVDCFGGSDYPWPKRDGLMPLQGSADCGVGLNNALYLGGVVGLSAQGCNGAAALEVLEKPSDLPGNAELTSQGVHQISEPPDAIGKDIKLDLAAQGEGKCVVGHLLLPTAPRGC